MKGSNTMRTQHTFLEETKRLNLPGFGQRAAFMYGKAYTWTEKPRGWRMKPLGKCFQNSALLALEPGVAYVEGYARRGWVFWHHGWVTLDGIHAVDVTWRDAGPETEYFGVEIPTKVLWDSLNRCVFGPVLDNPLVDELMDTCDLRPLRTLTKINYRRLAQVRAESVCSNR
jgi:hypothetical protein